MGMGGVQRTSKFVKYLKEFGWEPFVLTSTPKNYYATDNSLLAELKTKDIKIFRTNDREDNRIEDPDSNRIKYYNERIRLLKSKLSKAVFLPDRAILWKAEALKSAEKIINEEKIDLIFSTAPPYTSLLIGRKLKKKYQIPLVIDYRDAWYDCPYNFYPTPIHSLIHKHLEKSVLDCSDKTITINKVISGLITKRYSLKGNRIPEIISQGFDDEDFCSVPKMLDERFTITYSGSFFNLMTPEYFLKGFRIAADWQPELISNTRLVFAGLFPEKYLKLIQMLGLSDVVELKGYLSHSDSIRLIMNSHALWMMIGRSKWSDMISTGKIFEYIRTYKPILACIPEGAAKDVLKKYGCSYFAEPDVPADIAGRIIELRNNYLKNSLPEPDKEYVSDFSRRKLTEKLAGIFNEV